MSSNTGSPDTDVGASQEWVLEALYGADDEMFDMAQYCGGCGEELADPQQPFCPACRMVGGRTAAPDESLVNP